MSRFCIAACIASALAFSGTALADDEGGIEFFETKIRPVLVQRCYECHSAEANKSEGGLRLDSREGLLQGGDNGPAIVAGAPDESLLLSAIKYEDFEMPPAGRVADSIADDFAKWIEIGAPDPREGEAKSEDGEIDFEEAARFWAFQAPRKSDLPTVRDSAWPLNEIDLFVLARMEQESLRPVRTTDKRELLRRATFDLIGLPPTLEETEAFLADDSPDAYARLIDRLLASPHYGERWGRHWLDVARYAEDQAHTFGVRPNSEAWRYRQWVIDALNDDMAYDQFVRMQIAGDQLDETLGYDRFVALGYFGLGAVYYKNSDKAKAEADELDDRVDTLTRGFLGLTVSCARCHDHKFDPIPTSDYYSLAGIFDSSPLASVPLTEPDVVKAYDEGQKRIEIAKAAVADRTRELRESFAEASVDTVSEHLLAIRTRRAAKVRDESLSREDLAQSTGLSATSMRLWEEFLESDKAKRHAPFAEWLALAEPTARPPTDDDRQVAERAANAVERTIQDVIAKKDGRPGATTDPESSPTTEPLFASPPITRESPSVEIDVALNGSRELYLVISDAGDGNSCDHADWIDPVLVTNDGEIRLTDLKWRSATAGYGSVNLNRSVAGEPLRIGDSAFVNGIGTHAPCVIAYDLPLGALRFRATAGLDVSGTGQGSGATVTFAVFDATPPKTFVTSSDDQAKDAVDSKITKAETELLKDVFGDGGLFRLSDTEFDAALSDERKAELATLKSTLETVTREAPPMYPVAHAIRDDRPKDMHVFIRGNPARKGEVAPRRFLRILESETPEPYVSGSGRRELADDIASDANPLTARVLVNRVWQHHFGRGIVSTPSNFGRLGDPPSHPELLDWLTVDFMEHGWSIKHLHRRIMLSATYRLSSEYDSRNAEIDGDARYLWRMNRRRLDVEAWRDSLLSVSGELDRTIGGENGSLQGNRRTVYAKISRHQLDELLRIFDFPDANVTSEKRTVTTAPQQQLFVLNSDFVVQRANALVERLRTDGASDEERIERAFRLLFSRPPSEEEMRVGLEFLVASASDAEDQKLDPWRQYAQALLSLNEFLYVD